MSIKNIVNIREEFEKSEIDFKNLPDYPLELFHSWFDMALEVDKDNAIAFVLSSVSSEMVPSSRIVLLRGVSEEGFTFFTNYESRKAKDIEKNNIVSLNFYWEKLEKQVRITGKAVKISSTESDKYFGGRPRKSQLGAWSSNQSKVIDLYYKLMNKVEKFEGLFEGKKVERPLHWGGYCVEISTIEFWQGRPSRLHDRLLYTKERNNWKKERLAP
ncbi:MAG: pyridoxamine 5'-phosphate oxidase [Flavobacteriales bacterium]